MTDSLKLAEMQRTSIEFERQRHLANWFIKSSPHMAKSSNGYPDAATNVGKGGQKSMMNISSCAKNNGGTITTTNPLFYVMNSSSHPAGGHQKPAVTSSGVNIGGGLHHPSSMGVHHQEGRKPKLRRFNSHDTSANMFSVADFENARLARRNEIEMKQRLQLQNHKMKLNSLSSGGDCSTGDSKGSKYSSDSQNDPLQADLFLDRYSLPRVVRISYKSKFSQETLQSSFSNGSSTTQSSLASSDSNNHNTSSKQSGIDIKPNGELFLLHRYLKQRRIYHALNTKTSSANRKKGIKIPQEYPGYFSLINEKGTATATLYTTLIQLVRERVYKFISVDNLAAFTESVTGENYSGRPHYIKTNTRGGQVFRLLAVFEDGNQEQTATSKTANNLGREKEKGRYAQLLNENRQILYVSLSTKGKFYEIEPGIPQLLQKVSKNDFPKKLNPDCVHRITTLITTDNKLPIQLKYISGPIAGASNSVIPENVTIVKISTEDVIIGCPIDNFETQQSHLQLGKIIITPEMHFLKCFLGFENEQRMLANHNVQNILKFCQFNCDQFLKMTEIEIFNHPERLSNKNRNDGLKILKPLNFPKLLRREKSTIAHEKEDSIIFLSKNDLANMETKEQHEPSLSHQNRITERMKVFQSTKKKWFSRSEKNTAYTSLDIDAHSKRMSMERYNDMSKLVQERFGEMLDDTTTATSERTTSEIGVTEAKPKTHIIQKSLSLQEVDFASKRDVIPNKFRDLNATSESLTQIDQTIAELSEQKPIFQNADNNEVKSESIQKMENQRQSSFITEKLYSEFHVKTRQYSKSSSSLHQLLHFSVPQKMNVVEAKKINQINEKSESKKIIDFNIGEAVSHRDCASSIGLVDDLPYSSVRDSLLVTEKTNRTDHRNNNRFSEANTKSQDQLKADCIKENIYAEICHENQTANTRCNTGASAISRIQINNEHGSIFDHESSSLVECNISSSNEEDTDNEINYSSISNNDHEKCIEVTVQGAAAASDNNNLNDYNIYNTLK